MTVYHLTVLSTTSLYISFSTLPMSLEVKKGNPVFIEHNMLINCKTNTVIVLNHLIFCIMHNYVRCKIVLRRLRVVLSK